MEKVHVEHLGLIDYQKAWDYQEELNKDNVQIKLNNRLPETKEIRETHHHLLFCEHPITYTLGKSGSMDNLLLSEQQLDAIGGKFYKINRGGDITHHGPGQLVMYPIFDLEKFFTDIHKFLRYMEEAVIQTLAYYGIKGERYPGYTGVWLDADDDEKARKICAMGIRCSRWVTMHGIAFNINNDLDYFNHIVPCGIDDKAVTSLAKELGHEVDINEVRSHLLDKMADLFKFESA
ncbi:lipoyl(octanoyl) transferase LipB [bacterium SCSIO 12741]|nr:lipoyl(octanoyl) transferase LipB [bacterium SCSIO 12741]